MKKFLTLLAMLLCLVIPKELYAQDSGGSLYLHYSIQDASYVTTHYVIEPTSVNGAVYSFEGVELTPMLSSGKSQFNFQKGDEPGDGCGVYVYSGTSYEPTIGAANTVVFSACTSSFGSYSWYNRTKYWRVDPGKYDIVLDTENLTMTISEAAGGDEGELTYKLYIGLNQYDMTLNEETGLYVTDTLPVNITDWIYVAVSNGDYYGITGTNKLKLNVPYEATQHSTVSSSMYIHVDPAPVSNPVVSFDPENKTIIVEGDAPALYLTDTWGKTGSEHAVIPPTSSHNGVYTWNYTTTVDSKISLVNFTKDSSASTSSKDVWYGPAVDNTELAESQTVSVLTPAKAGYDEDGYATYAFSSHPRWAAAAGEYELSYDYATQVLSIVSFTPAEPEPVVTYGYALHAGEEDVDLTEDDGTYTASLESLATGFYISRSGSDNTIVFYGKSEGDVQNGVAYTLSEALASAPEADARLSITNSPWSTVSVILNPEAGTITVSGNPAPDPVISYKVCGDLAQLGVDVEVALEQNEFVYQGVINVTNSKGADIVVKKYADDTVVATYGNYGYDEDEGYYWFDADTATPLHLNVGEYEVGFQEVEGMAYFYLRPIVWSYEVKVVETGATAEVTYDLEGDIDAGYMAEVTVKNDATFTILKNRDEELNATIYNAAEETVLYDEESGDVNITTEDSENGHDFQLAAGTYIISYNPRGYVAIMAQASEDPEEPTEGSYTIVYISNESDSSAAFGSDNTKYLAQVSEGGDYASVSESSNVYGGKNGLKFSSSKNAGSLKLAIAEGYQKNATKVVINAVQYESGATLSVNGGDAQSMSSESADYTYTLDGSKLTELTLTASKRLYVKSITVYYSTAPTPDVITYKLVGDFDGKGETAIDLEVGVTEGELAAAVDVTSADATIKVAKYVNDEQAAVYGLAEAVTMVFEDGIYEEVLGADAENSIAFGCRGMFTVTVSNITDETVDLNVHLDELYPDVEEPTEGSYTIVYISNESDSSAAFGSDNTKYLAQVSEGGDYASVSESSNVYGGKNGLKFSSSKNAGSLKLAIAEGYQKNATKVVINAVQYESGATLSVNGGDAQSMSSESADYTYTLDGSKLTELTLTASKRLYVKSITVYYSASEPVVGDDQAKLDFEGGYVENASEYTLIFLIDDDAQVYYTTYEGENKTEEECAAAIDDPTQAGANEGDSNTVLKFKHAFMVKAYAVAEGKTDSDVKTYYVSEETATGISLIDVENSNAVYYRLDGTRIAKENVVPGLYIRREGNKISKVLVK